MQAGRPVLIVPTDATRLKLEEARRAVSDALPLLKHATEVSIVEIAAEDDLAAANQHVDDVAT